MNINVITKRVQITAARKGSITKFVKKRCSYYYFLNYIRITSGNVKDAIELYKFDEELRMVLLKYILQLEIQMKKDFVECVIKNTCDDKFWMNQKYFKARFIKKPKNKAMTSFDTMNSKINKRIKEMNFNSSDNLDQKVFYSITFGTFRTLYNEMIFVYHKDFTEQYLFPDKNSADKLNTYLCCIQKIRNRCCHSNHVLSIKLKNEIKYNKLETLNKNVVHSNFEKCLYFVYENVNEGRKFKRELIHILKKYQKYWKPYSTQHILTSNIIHSINNYW